MSPHQHYEALLTESLRPTFRVLDLGCGARFPMAPFLTRLVSEVHGVDPMVKSDSGIAPACMKQARAEELPYPSNTFDAVVCESVLEHLPDPFAAFRELWRVMKSDGIVVFLTPSCYDWVSLAARAVPNGLHARIIRAIEGRAELDTFPTYYRANSASRIKRIAASSGFVVERLSYLSHYPYLLTWSPLLCRIAIGYDKITLRVWCLDFLRSSIIGLLRKSDRSPAGPPAK
jgi:SAM-dependent methyltransferase